MDTVQRRSILSLFGGSIVALSGCQGRFETKHDVFRLELVNARDDDMVFNVLIEQEDTIVRWDPFEVKAQDSQVGQRAPELGLDDEIEGPLDIRVQAEGQHDTVTLGADRLRSTTDREEAETHVLFWAHADGTFVGRD